MAHWNWEEVSVISDIPHGMIHCITEIFPGAYMLKQGVHSSLLPSTSRARENWNQCLNIFVSCVDFYFPDDINLWVNKPWVSKPERSTGGYGNILYCITSSFRTFIDVTRNQKVQVLWFSFSILSVISIF